MASYQGDQAGYRQNSRPISAWPSAQSWKCFFYLASPYCRESMGERVSPKDFPMTHKIRSTFPKCWELHDDSPLMLKPPTATAVEQVPDSEISKCFSWLESFAARSAHSSTISSTSMEAVYNFLQKSIMFVRASAARDTLKNDVSCLESSYSGLTQRFLKLNLCHMMLESWQPNYTHISICWDAAQFWTLLP